ncbi:hypothetical protein FQN50_002818 [Emmonsiellopsis sp. PD_5]|nr:hypothetical protein FQN50_002818 [Emmonsiellopsis sp. PD_5]
MDICPYSPPYTRHPSQLPRLLTNVLPHFPNSNFLHRELTRNNAYQTLPRILHNISSPHLSSTHHLNQTHTNPQLPYLPTAPSVEVAAAAASCIIHIHHHNDPMAAHHHATNNNANANANANATQQLTFYPAYCHKVSPTFFSWVKMAAVDIHRLKTRKGFEGQNLHFHLNHPIQFVCVAGIILSRDEHEHRSILVLDDSSGACLEIVCAKAPNSPNPITTTTPTPTNPTTTHLTSTTTQPLSLTPLVPGVRAKLRGTLTSFRGVMQVALERYEVIADMRGEVRFWEERTKVLVGVLGVPWVVAGEVVEGLRREAEGMGVGVGGGAGKVGGNGVWNGVGVGGEAVQARARRRLLRLKERERLREVRRGEREERGRLVLEEVYRREEVRRGREAERCRELGRLVGRRGGGGGRGNGGGERGVEVRRRD